MAEPSEAEKEIQPTTHVLNVIVAPHTLAPLAVSALLAGLLWSWIIFVGADVVAPSLPGLDQAFMPWCKAAQFVAFLAGFFASSRLPSSRGILAISLGFGLVSSILPVIAAIVPFSPEAILLISSVLSGFTYAALLLRWAATNLLLDYYSIFVITGLATIFASCWRSFLDMVPLFGMYFATPLSITFVVGTLIWLEQHPWEGSLLPGSKKTMARQQPGALANTLFFLALAIAGGVVASLLTKSWVALGITSITAEMIPFQLLLLGLIIFLRQRAFPELILSFIIGVSCLGVLCALFMTPDNPVLSVILFSSTRLLLAFSFAAAICRCSSLKKPLTSVAFVYGGIVTASTIGYFVALMIPPFNAPILSVSAVLLAFALIFILLSSMIAAQQRASGDAVGTEVSENINDIDASCRTLAQTYGLTEREYDVLCLLARGYSLKGIAEKLVVSDNTVKSHRTHIYQKLGISSRQSLIDMIERSATE